ncbi:MAG: FkbM family methyltransferase, partial [Candidatus Omnitrophica bacterium]|nr:FkbM family methyltransferase [Candidatus Omnitrophota bacterium]
MNFLRKLYPLSFREYLFYNHVLPRINVSAYDFSCASLVFSPQVKLRLLSSDVMHQCIGATGFYELGLTRTIAGLAKKGGLLVDAGANIGYYSCLWLGINPRSHVIAFEPNPRCITYLEQNLNSNGFSSRADMQSKALGNESKEALFDIGPQEQLGWGGLSSGERLGAIKISLMKLDDFMQGQDVDIEVLKIDTEGSDALVLFGAKGLLEAKKIYHLFFEINRERMELLGIEKNEPFRFLKN